VLTLVSNQLNLNKMRKIKIFLVTVLAFNMFVSCEDAYNIDQDGVLLESVAVTSVADMQTYLNGIYANVTVSNEAAYTAMLSDETGLGVGTGGQNFDLHRYFVNQANGFVSTIWYGHYRTINRVNRLLKAVATIPVPTDPTDLANYNKIVGEAKTLRAFSYLQLLTCFSPVMKNDNALGVVFVGDDIPEVGDERVRSSNGVVFNAIIADLNAAYANVPATSATNYKFVTKGMIDAMRARMYVYRGDYANAAIYAQDAITNSATSLTLATPAPAGLTTVGTTQHTAFSAAASTNPYRRMFADLARGEMIFSLDRPNASTWENIGSNFAFNASNRTGGLMFEVGRKLFNLMEAMPNNDVRKYANVDPTALVDTGYLTNPNFNTSDVLPIDKYPGKTGTVLRNDIKVFRLSEMYLILAECQARGFGGSLTDAATTIKQIRDARAIAGPTTLPAYATVNDALIDIMQERRVELCFEGHRIIDIKRVGPEVNISIDRDPTDDIVSSIPLTISNTSYKLTMPIPSDELNANTVIQQNPGY
jgi:hypothetical protein